MQLEGLLRQYKTHCDVIMVIYCDLIGCMKTNHIVVVMEDCHVDGKYKQLHQSYVGRHKGPEGSNVPLPIVCVGRNWFASSQMF